MADEQKTAGSPKKEPSIRKKMQLARLALLKKGKERPRVRVVPRDDTMRSVLKHPRAGKFRSSGGLEWPDDTFTRRRLADGSVTLEPSRNNGGTPSSRGSRAAEASVVE